ncbi:MAG: hypothetical protein M1544_01665 [Candidatus Marsarchaeota archaeon]|nr:hypothetical protein [Candidatus Marsarchaeota archaeon]MCL5102043.1 hypothetical protein [Candidatus Marsarchaeota archaeon]
MTKILSIISSKEKEKISLGLNFSARQKQAGHDVRVLFFGPSEVSVANDEELGKLIQDSFGGEKPSACVFVAQNAQIEEKLSKKLNLVKAGEYITKSIDEGYTPISF